MRKRIARAGIALLVCAIGLGTAIQGAGGNVSALAKVQAQEKSAKPRKDPDVQFVPTPPDVVEEMLKLAEVKKNDVVYDLGCGDGRIVILAAKKYGARGVRIDIDPERIRESKVKAEKEGVADRAKFREEELFEADIKQAAVVTLFLLNSLN